MYNCINIAHMTNCTDVL